MNSVEQTIAQLKPLAKEVCSRAHAPYSQFPVGAAVLDEAGGVFVGCNVENASFGLTLCAERNALAAAVAAGASRVETVLIYTPGEQAHPPCGACRQVIEELMEPDARIISCCDSKHVRSWTVAEVLPDPFCLISKPAV